MTQQSSIARAAKLERPGIAWIGRFHVDGEAVDFTVGEADLERDSQWAASLMRQYGVCAGEHILITSRPSESPWLDAFRDGARLIGAVHSNGESWGWDARRSEMYIRRLNTVLIIGLSSDTIDGISQMTDAAERLSSVRKIIARQEAVGPLQELGIEADSYRQIGPVLAVSAPGGGLRYNESEWIVESIDGQLVVSTVGPRATKFVRQPTGITGRVVMSAEGARILLPGN